MTKTMPEGRTEVPRCQTSINKETYRLSFIRGNVQQYQFLQFHYNENGVEELNIMELVKSAKRYCERTGNRFVHLDRAVITIDVTTGEPIQEEG